jgi:hypothetical protein
MSKLKNEIRSLQSTHDELVKDFDRVQESEQLVRGRLCAYLCLFVCDVGKTMAFAAVKG